MNADERRLLYKLNALVFDAIRVERRRQGLSDDDGRKAMLPPPPKVERLEAEKKDQNS